MRKDTGLQWLVALVMDRLPTCAQMILHYYQVRAMVRGSNCPKTYKSTAFGGEFQPGRYKAVADRKIANPAPLGLSAFALTTFVLSLINVGARDVTEPNIVVALAFGYGGLVQLLAGMWYVMIGAVGILLC